MSPRITRLVRFGTLFLCALLAVVWWHSGRGTDVVIKGSGNGYCEYTAIAGQVRITRVEGLNPGPGWTWYANRTPPTLMVFGHQVLGSLSPLRWEFTRHGSQNIMWPPCGGTPGYAGARRLVPTTYRLVAIPFPFLMLLLLMPTTVHLFKIRGALARRIMRQSAGLCATCGYDLRGGGSRCPECGTPRDAAAPASRAPSSASVIPA